MDLHEMEKKTVNDLREMAIKYEDIKGVSGLRKEELLEILCEKLGIDRHVHVPEGIGRRDIKARIKELKLKRKDALDKHDRAALATVRHEIKSNKRHLRRVIDRALRHQVAPAAPKAD